MNIESLSKYLSYLLRHKPESIGLSLTKEGYASIDEIISKSIKTPITREQILLIVSSDSKTRYKLSEDNESIRANQGHSTSSVALTYSKKIPGVKLYHGTSASTLKIILKQGLLPMNRSHVHLSADIETATEVSKRRKNAIAILEIDAKSMVRDGKEFFLSENNVWLIDAVEPKYLKEIT